MLAWAIDSCLLRVEFAFTTMFVLIAFQIPLISRVDRRF